MENYESLVSQSRPKITMPLKPTYPVLVYFHKFFFHK